MSDSVPTTVVHSYPVRGGAILVTRRGRRLTLVRAQGDAVGTDAVAAALRLGSAPCGDGYAATLTSWYGIPRGHAATPEIQVGRDGRRVRVRGAGRCHVAPYPAGAESESLWRSIILTATSVILDAANSASTSDVAAFFPTRVAPKTQKVSSATWNRVLTRREKSRRSRK